MRMSRFAAFSIPLVLAASLSACGNKGNLVKPIPSTLPPPAPADQPANQPAKPDTPAATHTTPQPAQESGGH
jgi:predicted small lipoprotein YifL